MPDINPDVVPKSLQEAVTLICDGLTDEERESITTNPKADVQAHHGFGQWIRNNWSLWDTKTHLVQWFKENLDIMHGDDISGIILANVVANVQGRDFDPAPIVERYHAHWARMGCDNYGRPL